MKQAHGLRRGPAIWRCCDLFAVAIGVVGNGALYAIPSGAGGLLCFFPAETGLPFSGLLTAPEVGLHLVELAAPGSVGGIALVAGPAGGLVVGVFRPGLVVRLVAVVLLPIGVLRRGIDGFRNT